MYKESGCLRGQTQRFPWGAEVREAESPSWEGTGSTVACRFLKIKTGPETASVWWLVSPHPHSHSKVFPFSSKHVQSSSGQYPVFEKGGRINRKKRKPQTPALHCQHTRRTQGQGTRTEVSFMSQSQPSCRGWAPHSIQTTTQPAGFSLGKRGGAEAGLQGTPGGGAVLGTQRTPPATTGCSESPASVRLVKPCSLNQVAWPSGHITGWGTFWGPSCAAAVATLPGRKLSKKTKQSPPLPCPSAQAKTL